MDTLNISIWIKFFGNVLKILFLPSATWLYQSVLYLPPVSACVYNTARLHLTYDSTKALLTKFYPILGQWPSLWQKMAISKWSMLVYRDINTWADVPSALLLFLLNFEYDPQNGENSKWRWPVNFKVTPKMKMTLEFEIIPKLKMIQMKTASKMKKIRTLNQRNLSAID